MVEKKFLKAVKEFQLIQPQDKILIAFSGGIDSTVLTYLLIKLRKYLQIDKLALAHLNHKLRGQDSDLDEKFALEFGKKHNIPVFTKSVDIKILAKERKKSIEEVAREERYKFFKEILKKENLNKIATGHHLSDLVETMFLWFIQGNKKGIKGFKPKDNNIIRPLYLIKKEEIESYAKERNIPYRVDITNFQTDFLRNKVRHLIIPEAKKINPSIETSFFYMSYFLNLDEDFFKEELKRLSQNFQKDEIKLKWFLDLPEAIQYRFLQEWVYRKTGIFLSYKQLYDLIKIIKKEDGTKEYSISGKYLLTKSYQSIKIKGYNRKPKKSYLYTLKPGDEVVLKEVGLKIKAFYADEKILRENIFNDKNFVCFSIDEENPIFEIRPRMKGDRFIPFGRSSEKKLKDIMIDLKIPKDMRDTIPLLTHRNKILWIVGYKRSNLFPIDKTSKKIICFKTEEV